jgi:hypothetical protein
MAGRPKGSKNKPKVKATVTPDVLKGNADFNINDLPEELKADLEQMRRNGELDIPPMEKRTNAEVAMAAITDEDLAFERELQRAAFEEPIIDDPGPATTFKKEADKRELLSEHVEGIEPAKSVNELLSQVHTAKEAGCDSIEATPEVVRYYCRKHYPDDVGYFIFQDVKVYIAGLHKTKSAQDKLTVEQKLFGGSKTK